jgi:hypothetical protein
VLDWLALDDNPADQGQAPLKYELAGVITVALWELH